MQSLQANPLLQGGRYKIIKTLGQGGFGITYLAIQSGLNRKVAIKEFFMKELCERDESTSQVTLGTEGSRETVACFRGKFLKEARNLAKLNHPNIVRIIDVFEENGTAYYVMEYVENGSLADKVKREGYLSEPMATRYIIQVANALDYIHQQKMNHLDVKPANIMLNEKDECVLIDFGLSKQYDASTGNQTSTTPVGISDGYAPMEQYKPGGVGEFSPETDVYSLGATFFKLLTGTTPPSASDINEDGVPIDELKAKGVSQNAIDIICKAMEGRKRDRMKSIRTFIDGLKDKALSTSNLFSKKNEDDEATVLTVDSQKREAERLRKEAEAKAAKEKVEAELRARQETERRARKEAERKLKEDERVRNAQSQNSTSKKIILWYIFGIIAFIILLIMLRQYSNNSCGTEPLEEATDTTNSAIYDSSAVDGNNSLKEKYAEYKKVNEEFMKKIAISNNTHELGYGVSYEIIKYGSGEIPTENDRVVVHYEGKTIDGNVFDSSYRRNEPVEFAVNEVIAGWVEALTHMPVGSKWIVYIPADAAYGAQEQGPIKPYSTLIFTIELLNIVTN